MIEPVPGSLVSLVMDFMLWRHFTIVLLSRENAHRGFCWRFSCRSICETIENETWKLVQVFGHIFNKTYTFGKPKWTFYNPKQKELTELTAQIQGLLMAVLGIRFT